MSHDTENSLDDLKDKETFTDINLGDRRDTQEEPADVEDKAEKLAVAEVQDAEQLSAWVEKVDGSMSVGGTDVGYHCFSHHEEDYYGELGNQNQLWKPNTSEAGEASMADKTVDLEVFSGNKWLKDHHLTGPGLQRLQDIGSSHYQIRLGLFKKFQEDSNQFSRWAQAQAQVPLIKSKKSSGLGLTKNNLFQRPMSLNQILGWAQAQVL